MGTAKTNLKEQCAISDAAAVAVDVNFCQFYELLDSQETPSNSDHAGRKCSIRVRIFERQTDTPYFTAHGENAVMMAKIYYHSEMALMKNTAIPSICISHTMLKKIVKDLIFARQSTVEIWKFQNNKWAVSLTGSPGHVADLEDLLAAEEESILYWGDTAFACLVSARNNTRSITGISLLDFADRQIKWFEFEDDESLRQAESIFLQNGVKECVIPEGTDIAVNQQLRHVCKRCSVALTEIRKTAFSAKGMQSGKASFHDDLQQLLSGNEETASAHVQRSDLKSLLKHLNALRATLVLVRHLRLSDDSRNKGQYALIQGKMTEQVRDVRSDICLYTFLNQCKTSMGSKLLMRWMKQPLMDHLALEARYCMVDLLVTHTASRQSLRENQLRGMPDMERISRNLHRGSAKLVDLLQLYRTTLRCKKMLNSLQEIAANLSKKFEVLSNVLSTLNECLEVLEGLRALVEEAFDTDAYISRRVCMIRRDFHPELNKLHVRKTQLREMMEKEKHLVSAVLNSDPTKLRLERHPVHGFHLRATKKEEPYLRKKRHRFIVLGTQKAGLLFTTPGLQEIQFQYAATERRFLDLQATYTSQAIEATRTYLPSLRRLASAIAEIDIFCSFAHIAASNSYVRPQISPAGSPAFVLTDARHPCLEKLGNMEFIPNDLLLNKSSRRLLFVTGPNMGGKSTYLRTVGTIVLMAHIGSYVPCSSATIPLFDQILVRFGAVDSLAEGVSTFMNEMMEVSHMLQAATTNSLILIDELGRGTSTNDGYGLAYAISKDFLRIGCFCLFATHFHELTDIEKDVGDGRGIANCHVRAVETDTGGIAMLYKICDGPSDKSFGLQVAKIAKLPLGIISLAADVARELDARQQPETGYLGILPVTAKRAKVL